MGKALLRSLKVGVQGRVPFLASTSASWILAIPLWEKPQAFSALGKNRAALRAQSVGEEALQPPCSGFPTFQPAALGWAQR